MNTRMSVMASIVSFFALLALMPVSVEAQETGRIRGTVTDTEGQPIVDASVSVVGTTIASPTNEEGGYVILNLAPGSYTLEAKRIGYASKRVQVTVTADAAAEANFQLEYQGLTLGEIVVTGVTGPTEGIMVPFRVNKVTKENLAVPTTSSALGVIQGKVAGAQVIRGDGRPGSGVTILLRTYPNMRSDAGVSNTPMIIVDGVILGETQVMTRDIESLDIVDVEVLSGASAATLYGSRAANGVISITTARGNDLGLDRTEISYRGEFGYSTIADAHEKATHHRFEQAANGDWLDLNGNPVPRNERAASSDGIIDNPYFVPIYDNQARFFDSQPTLLNTLAVSQNSANTNFRASFTRLDQKGAVIASEGFERSTARLNLDHRLRDDFSVSLSVSHSKFVFDFDTDQAASPFQEILLYDPVIDVLAKDDNGMFLRFPDEFSEDENPLWRESIEDNQQIRVRTLASASVSFSPFSWLRFRGQLSYDRSDNNEEEFIAVGFPIDSDSDETDARGRLEAENENIQAMNGTFSGTVLRNFGDLTTSLTGSWYFERQDEIFQQGVGTQFAVSGTRDLDAATQQSLTGSRSAIRTEGGSVSLSGNYAGKYIGDLTLRRDGSSLFGPSERWNNYYRAAAAWRMAEEPWWPFDALTEFKVRYAIGTAGVRPPFSARFETWGLTQEGFPFKSSIGNTALQPSRTTEQDFGVTFILNNRYSVDLSYVKQVTDRQINQVPIAAVTGFSTGFVNVGEAEGTTIEATIEAQFINRQDLQWSGLIVLDRRYSRINEFGRACFFSSGSEGRHFCDGSDLAVFWGTTFVTSVDQLPEQDQAFADQFQVNDEGFLVWVGEGNDYTEGLEKDLWFTRAPSSTQLSTRYEWGMPFLEQDADGNNLITPIFDSQADLNFGWTNTVRWKGFQLNAQFFGQIGGQIYNNTKEVLFQVENHREVDQFGKPEGLKKPSLYYEDFRSGECCGTEFMDSFVEPADFVKLRELQVSYRFNADQLSRVGLGRFGMDELVLGVVGRGIFKLDRYSGLDVEVGSPNSRIDNQTDYPLTRDFTILAEIIF